MSLLRYDKNLEGSEVVRVMWSRCLSDLSRALPWSRSAKDLSCHLVLLCATVNFHCIFSSSFFVCHKMFALCSWSIDIECVGSLCLCESPITTVPVHMTSLSCIRKAPKATSYLFSGLFLSSEMPKSNYTIYTKQCRVVANYSFTFYHYYVCVIKLNLNTFCSAFS